MIQMLFPAMRIAKAQHGLVHVNGRAVGGTTTLATGNALRYDRYLAQLGVNLDAEFAELEREVPQTTDHRANWSPLTERLFATFVDMGLNPEVTPKFLHDRKCVACGMCVLGCKQGAKWTADELVEGVAGVRVVEGAAVREVVIEDGRARGVVVHGGVGVSEGGDRAGRPPVGAFAPHGLPGRLASQARGGTFLSADLVVLAAGGLGTPVILEASGVPARPSLFVDPVLCVAAPWQGAGLDRQLPMPFVSQQPRYILSPYFDWLSFAFNSDWRLPSGDIMSIMIKMADCELGSFDGKRLTKPLVDSDWDTIARAVDLSLDVLEAMGVPRRQAFLGTLNAGHPGGCFPLTEAEADTLHHAVLPPNLYLADATLFPRSMGNPPILTILALAKKVARMAAAAQ